MRPRHKAAEYGLLQVRGQRVDDASMRPRHKAAEYGRGNRAATRSRERLQ